MPTKHEPRLSLVTDGEEITRVKAPPPGLIRDSKVVILPGAGRGAAPLGNDGATPAVVGPSAPAPKMISPNAIGGVVLGRTTPTGRPVSATLSLPQRASPPAAPTLTAPSGAARSTPAQPGARVPTPTAPAPAPGRRSTASAAMSPPLGSSYQRPIVDLVPVSPRAGAMTFSVPAMSESPVRSRAGLYAILIALFVGGAGLVGWRQWSARPGQLEITTTPADAIISVDSDQVAQHSPYTLERPAGSYQISVAREGYQHAHQTVELAAGQQSALAIALTLTATTVGVEPLAPAAAQAARPASGQSAVHHVSSNGTAVTARRASTSASRSAAAAQPDPAIAAMLAGSHPLRDRPGTSRAEQADPPAAAAPAPEAPAPAPAAGTEEPAPAAPTRPASVKPAPSAAAAPPSSDTNGARSVPGRVAKAQLAIDPNAAEYRVALPPSLARADMKLAAVVKICVSPEGKVTDVKLLKSADPALDPQIPLVLSRWRFHPLMANGRAVPFCYVTQYEISAP
jgi:hypothetical protein